MACSKDHIVLLDLLYACFGEQFIILLQVPISHFFWCVPVLCEPFIFSFNPPCEGVPFLTYKMMKSNFFVPFLPCEFILSITSLGGERLAWNWEHEFLQVFAVNSDDLRAFVSKFIKQELCQKQKSKTVVQQ